jgi:acetoin:2,6-dichlorophenolindophenol oxidoreductase subunit beta
MSTLAEVPVSTTTGTEELTYRDAIIRALDEEMASSRDVILMGEDVASDGGVFKTSSGLVEKYGPERVLNTPICENGFTSVALGMALMGMRPVVEFMFADFLPTAGDAIVNQLPKYRFMSGGQCSVPVTLRVISGGTGRFGAQHSATGESWFVGLPGLRVCAASSPGAAYSLLKAAIRDPNPVLMHEHKALFALRGPVELGAVAKVGEASVTRSGSDVTIVATLLMAERALEAAKLLAAEGVDVEVVDPQWLHPLDMDTIRHSVEKTGRLLVVEEQVHLGSWGATVISSLAQEDVHFLRPPAAMSLPPELPMPYSPGLEDQVIPTAERIADRVRALLAG